jgi:hypothetical protein
MTALDEQDPTAEDQARGTAHMTLVGQLGDGAPYREADGPRDDWDRPYRIALIRLGYPLPAAEPYPTGWLHGVRDALRDALLAGAPPAALTALYDAAQTLFKAHVAAWAAAHQEVHT